MTKLHSRQKRLNPFISFVQMSQIIVTPAPAGAFGKSVKGWLWTRCCNGRRPSSAQKLCAWKLHVSHLHGLPSIFVVHMSQFALSSSSLKSMSLMIWICPFILLTWIVKGREVTTNKWKECSVMIVMKIHTISLVSILSISWSSWFVEFVLSFLQAWRSYKYNGEGASCGLYNKE